MSWFKENASKFSGSLLFDEPLSRYTYYRIGGPAQVFAVPKCLDDLRWLAKGVRETGIKYFILGSGSNVLISDEGFSGLVIRCHRMNAELWPGDLEKPNTLRTGSSVAVSALLKRAATEGWGGLEFLSGIPGSIGGVVAMNAGTHLGEAKDRLIQVEIFPLLGDSDELITVPRQELKYEYRKNLFIPKGGLVWSAEWEVIPEEPARVQSLIDATLHRRKMTQPVEYPSCGSVFKNPKTSGMSAWEVVDKLGLRGHQIGQAQFSEKHSNFIVNLGGATAGNVKALIDLAKERAEKELGITLEQEVIYLS